MNSKNCFFLFYIFLLYREYFIGKLSFFFLMVNFLTLLYLVKGYRFLFIAQCIVPIGNLYKNYVCSKDGIIGFKYYNCYYMNINTKYNIVNYDKNGKYDIVYCLVRGYEVKIINLNDYVVELEKIKKLLCERIKTAYSLRYDIKDPIKFQDIIEKITLLKNFYDEEIILTNNLKYKKYMHKLMGLKLDIKILSYDSNRIVKEIFSNDLLNLLNDKSMLCKISDNILNNDFILLKNNNIGHLVNTKEKIEHILNSSYFKDENLIILLDDENIFKIDLNIKKIKFLNCDDIYMPCNQVKMLLLLFTSLIDLNKLFIKKDFLNFNTIFLIFIFKGLKIENLEIMTEIKKFLGFFRLFVILIFKKQIYMLLKIIISNIILFPFFGDINVLIKLVKLDNNNINITWKDKLINYISFCGNNGKISKTNKDVFSYKLIIENQVQNINLDDYTTYDNYNVYFIEGEYLPDILGWIIIRINLRYYLINKFMVDNHINTRTIEISRYIFNILVKCDINNSDNFIYHSYNTKEKLIFSITNKDVNPFNSNLLLLNNNRYIGYILESNVPDNIINKNTVLSLN